MDSGLLHVYPADNQVIRLAAAVAEADNASVPVLLLDVKTILQSHARESSVERAVLIDLWKHDLIHMLLLAMRQDFTNVMGSWLTACQLSSGVAMFCVRHKALGLKFLSKELLSEILYATLQLLTKVLNAAGKQEKESRQVLLGGLSVVVSSLAEMMKNFADFALTVGSSKHFMQFLMIEDPQISLLAMAHLKTMLLASRAVLGELPQSRLHSIVDELCFKIASASSSLVVSNAVELLLTLMDLHPPVSDLFSSRRYRGFKSYVNKWKGHGFDREVNRFVHVLDVQSVQQEAEKILNNAAITIQAVFRGYLARKRMDRAAVAMSRFQLMYRNRRREKEEQNESLLMRKTKADQQNVRRRKELMLSREKQLKVIETIPASTVHRFYEDLQFEAATKIQAVWRGASARKAIASKMPFLRQNRAAVRIQRQVRLWLLLRRKRRLQVFNDLRPDGLTDARKCELQMSIARLREKYQGKSLSDEELKAQHEKMKLMMSNHITCLRRSRRQDEHRKALLAQLSVQAEMMSLLPSLKSCSQSDIDKYASHSTPIMMAAKASHVAAIDDLAKPWWMRLNDPVYIDSVFRRESEPLLDAFISDSDKHF